MTIEDRLENLYALHNRRANAAPDPVQFLHDFPRVEDREIVALLASSLAYGRVAQILHSVALLLERLGRRPAETLDAASELEVARLTKGFQHRWTTAAHVRQLLVGVQRMRKEWGSLESAFLDGFSADEEVPIWSALDRWVRRLDAGPLLADPSKGSACKRLHLFLRWMVREDEVDPGGWRGVPPCLLVVPLDVHMHRVGRALGFTRRRAADRLAVLEVTRGFRMIRPDDPARYDFALTRFGIREGYTERRLMAEIRSWRKPINP